MIVQTIDGNLLKSFGLGSFDAIVHGCNCYHTMGAGIAGQIAQLYPTAVTADNATPYGDVSKLGTFSYSVILGKGVIINMYTQRLPGREDPAVIIDSLRKGFSRLNATFRGWDTEDGLPTVGIPQIGAGIAGGVWADHAAVINEVTPDFNIVLVNFKPGA